MYISRKTSLPQRKKGKGRVQYQGCYELVHGRTVSREPIALARWTRTSCVPSEAHADSVLPESQCGHGKQPAGLVPALRIGVGVAAENGERGSNADGEAAAAAGSKRALQARGRG